MVMLVGWLPIIYHRWLNIIQFWNNHIALDNQRLTKLVFYENCENCRNNWFYELKDILSKPELSEYFDNWAVINMGHAESNIVGFYSRY